MSNIRNYIFENNSKEIIKKVKIRIIKKIKEISHVFGVELSKYEKPSDRARRVEFDRWETLSEFLRIHIERADFSLKTDFENGFIKFIIENFRQSKSQLFQDLLVLYIYNKKQNGFFVEFGATNGISFSNSYLLEKDFKWRGILAEPAKIWHSELGKNRDCKIDRRCVWDVSKENLSFNETECAELSTVEEFTLVDNLATARIKNNSYSVETVSLNDLQ